MASVWWLNGVAGKGVFGVSARLRFQKCKNVVLFITFLRPNVFSGINFFLVFFDNSLSNHFFLHVKILDVDIVWPRDLDFVAF